jgi:hypothetical protein
MIDEDYFEVVPDDVIKLKDNILHELEAQSTGVVIMSLMSALIEVIVTTGPNLDLCLKTVDHLKRSMEASIKACDEAGLCNWNETRQ